jgi:hypothetical protein
MWGRLTTQRDVEGKLPVAWLDSGARISREKRERDTCVSAPNVPMWRPWNSKSAAWCRDRIDRFRELTTLKTFRIHFCSCLISSWTRDAERFYPATSGKREAYCIWRLTTEIDQWFSTLVFFVKAEACFESIHGSQPLFSLSRICFSHVKR